LKAASAYENTPCGYLQSSVVPQSRFTIRARWIGAFEMFKETILNFTRDTNGMLNGDCMDVLREYQRGCLK
jgi:hypothetical protein